MYECSNCAYNGEQIIDDLFCPVCGDYIKGKKPGEIKLSVEERVIKDIKEFEFKPVMPQNILDLNQDGKVDGQDASLAGKVLQHRRRRKTQVI